MIADIIVIGIMALCIFLGYWRGLIHVAVRLLGFVVALIVALILYTPVSNYIIENTSAVERTAIGETPNNENIIEAFAYNSRLYKLKLGEGLKEIRGGAFRYCQKLEEIYFPASLEKIGKLAFEGCKKLKVVHVRRGTLISKSAFPKNTKIIYY